MSRPCQVCEHPKSIVIDARLASGETATKIAADTKLDASALRRHKHNKHAMRRSARERLVSVSQEPTSLLDSVRQMLSNSQLLATQALASGNVSVAAGMARESGRLAALAADLERDSLQRSSSLDRAVGLGVNVPDLHRRLLAKLGVTDDMEDDPEAVGL